ncbi:MAG: hypothetical protein QXK88_03345 [Desulfurococcaceae archaeon]
MGRSHTVPYVSPSSTVLILGKVNETLLGRLKSLLSLHKSRGMKIVIASTDTPRELKGLGELLYAVHASTIEVYTIDSNEVGDLVRKEGANIVAILSTDLDSVKGLPEQLRSVIEVI